jgi:hypothetical protein
VFGISWISPASNIVYKKYIFQHIRLSAKSDLALLCPSLRPSTRMEQLNSRNIGRIKIKFDICDK